MPTSYTWNLTAPPDAVEPVPNTGTPTYGTPGFGNARAQQFARGIKFGNVPGGRADNVVHGGPRVYHVNSVANVVQSTSDKIDLSGVVKFRNQRRKSYFKVPASVSPQEERNLDAFGNPIFPGTGR